MCRYSDFYVKQVGFLCCMQAHQHGICFNATRRYAAYEYKTNCELLQAPEEYYLIPGGRARVRVAGAARAVH